MPQADGLFQKGIIESGVYRIHEDCEKDGEEIVTAMLRELSLSREQVEELETIPYAKLASLIKGSAEGTGTWRLCRKCTS